MATPVAYVSLPILLRFERGDLSGLSALNLITAYPSFSSIIVSRLAGYFE